METKLEGPSSPKKSSPPLCTCILIIVIAIVTLGVIIFLAWLIHRGWLQNLLASSTSSGFREVRRYPAFVVSNSKYGPLSRSVKTHYTNVVPPELGDHFTLFNDNSLPEPTPQEAGKRNYIFYPHVGGVGIEIEHQSDLQYRPDQLLNACETMPGCIGFESQGVLFKTMKPKYDWELVYPDRSEGTWVIEGSAM